MSLFRRSFSRRLPDRLLEISERIYVSDTCLSTSGKTEKECKSYLGGVVTSLHNCHPGASFMVFNFREGDQMSLLSDILIDYDMTVVDYPCHYEGYPLLPLEMIHYFLRSSESWLSLEGQKNVILMHCERGGWPVLAFMLAGLLLYRKQYSEEQKTLEMVYKQAPKALLSDISPINPRASQLRYLQYITGRDSASEWPPSDAPVIVDYLLLRNLPLLNDGKGCRPVIRVYGQDPSTRANSARLLFSSSMADESVLKYSKEECVFVKLELRCQIQGDVFLECIHLHDDQVSEEMIFKVMFNTGFVRSNVLVLNSNDVDVTGNTNLPRDFKAEVLFRDMNEVPVNITLEVGGGEEFHDSDNEFFEVEEIFTPLPESEEKKDFEGTTLTETKLPDNQKKDRTLHNGTPRWDLDVEETDGNASKQKAVDEGSYKQASEQKSDILITFSKNTDEDSYKKASEAESDMMISLSKNIDEKCKQASEAESYIMITSSSNIDEGNYKQASETESDIMITSSKSTDEGSYKQASEAESDIIINLSKNIDKAKYKQALEAEYDIMITSSSNIDEGNYKQASETDSDIMITSSKSIDQGSYKYASEAESDIIINLSKNIDKEKYKQASEAESDTMITLSRNIDEGHYKQASEAKFETMINSSKSIDEEKYKQASEAESNIMITSSMNIIDEGNYKQASETKSNIMITSSKNIDQGNYKQASEAESDKFVTSLKISDEGNYKQASEADADKLISSSKNIVVVDLCGSETQEVKVDIEPKPAVPSPAKPKQKKNNKWQDITAKTIKQQRVISQWVPRTKTPPAPEANKPKVPVLKWVPKGPVTPTEAGDGE